MERGGSPHGDSLVVETTGLLAERGVEGVVRYPTEELVRLDHLRSEADLYLLRSNTELALSLATALEGVGARVVNTVAATMQAENKAVATAMLREAGFPQPRLLLAGKPDQLEAECAEEPLVLKPFRGHDPATLDVSFESSPELVFAQRDLPADGPALKVSVIGDEVFGVRTVGLPGSDIQGRDLVPLSPPLTDPTLTAVAAEGFLTRLGFGMVGFALPLYALSLGMGYGEIGLLYTLRSTTTLLLKPTMGRVADRFGGKRALIAAVVLRCLVSLLLAFATAPWHLFAIRSLQGTVSAVRSPSATILIAEHADKRSMASAFAWSSTARDVGASLGVGVAGLLIQATGGYRGVFLVAFGTSCAALVLVVRYVREHRKDATEPTAGSAELAPIPPHPFAYRRLYPYAGFGLMVAGSAEMMKGFFPIIATQYAHLSEGQAGLVVTASGLVFLVAGPGFGWLSDNVSRSLALGSWSVANAVSSLLYIVFPTFQGFLLARVVDDTGKAAFKPTWGAMMAEVSADDPVRRGRTVGFVDTGVTLGEILGPLVAGLLMAGFGVPVMLGVRATLSLVAEAQAIRLMRRRSFSSGPSPGEQSHHDDLLPGPRS